MMHPHRLLLIAINVLGGIAVLGSYAWGFMANPSTRDQLWGSVPEALVPLYTITMLSAAIGYFLFTAYFLFKMDPDRVRFFGRWGFGLVQTLYVGILLPSALWMPLTFAMLEGPSPWLWWLIRLVLAMVGGCSVLLLVALLRSHPDRSRASFRAAVVGLIAFSLQTAFLDAIVWPHFFV